MDDTPSMVIFPVSAFVVILSAYIVLEALLIACFTRFPRARQSVQWKRCIAASLIVVVVSFGYQGGRTK